MIAVFAIASNRSSPTRVVRLKYYVLLVSSSRNHLNNFKGDNHSQGSLVTYDFAFAELPEAYNQTQVFGTRMSRIMRTGTAVGSPHFSRALENQEGDG